MKHTAIAQMTVPSQCHMEWNHTVKWTVLTISATPGELDSWQYCPSTVAPHPAVTVAELATSVALCPGGMW